MSQPMEIKRTHARPEILVVKMQKEVRKEATPPAHHANDSMTRFRNPWSSFRFLSILQWVKFSLSAPFSMAQAPKELASRIPSQVPNWGAGRSPEGIKATWLGHACFLVELSTPKNAARGPRILFDPVLSHRCSPVQWLGPTRLLPTPCAAEDLPEVDAVVLSHNHYDHMDFPTLRTVNQLHRPHFFAPLGNTPHLASIGIAPTHIHTLDWWEESAVTVTLPPAEETAVEHAHECVKATFSVTCTPAQHVANRTAFDRWHTLWASWVIEDDLSPRRLSARPATVASVEDEHTSSEQARPPRKVFFAGDTGYRTVFDGENEDEVPRCPAFAEIGDKFGGFDLALLPIGAYAPRGLFSGLHASPGDAVQIYKDVRARKALAMHWGTWVLTTEPIMEPPELLKAECAEAGLDENAFVVCGLGETSVV